MILSKPMNIFYLYLRLDGHVFIICASVLPKTIHISRLLSYALVELTFYQLIYIYLAGNS